MANTISMEARLWYEGVTKVRADFDNIIKCDIRSMISHILHKFIYYNYYQMDGKAFYYKFSPTTEIYRQRIPEISRSQNSISDRRARCT